MTSDLLPHADPLLSCHVCLTEIPASVGSSLEGREYVHYFFGPDCFAIWEKRQLSENNEQTR